MTTRRDTEAILPGPSAQTPRGGRPSSRRPVRPSGASSIMGLFSTRGRPGPPVPAEFVQDARRHGVCSRGRECSARSPSFRSVRPCASKTSSSSASSASAARSAAGRSYLRSQRRIDLRRPRRRRHRRQHRPRPAHGPLRRRARRPAGRRRAGTNPTSTPPPTISDGAAPRMSWPSRPTSRSATRPSG